MEYAYARIQRLMVTGNFALLAGIDPDEVDGWYLGVYIDALEWVKSRIPRHGQFADGGIVGSKPYVSSAQYIKKMGRTAKAAITKPMPRPVKSLPVQWALLAFPRAQPRQARAQSAHRDGYARDKMAPEKQQALLETAEMNLNRIEEL